MPAGPGRATGTAALLQPHLSGHGTRVACDEFALAVMLMSHIDDCGPPAGGKARLHRQARGSDLSVRRRGDIRKRRFGIE